MITFILSATLALIIFNLISSLVYLNKLIKKTDAELILVESQINMLNDVKTEITSDN